VISLLEIAERARSGPKLREKAWNLGVFQTMQTLVHRYRLERADHDVFFQVDAEYCDRAFHAAVQFLVERGVYCISSNRVIQLSEDEVYRAIRAIPSDIVIGSGRETTRIAKREVADPRRLQTKLAGHGPWSEDLLPLPLIVRNLAQVSRCAMIEGFNFTRMDGWEVYGLPLEAYAAKRAVGLMREGIQKAGRPGTSIVYYPISTQASTLLAPIDPHTGLRRSDGILLSMLPDIKVEYSLLTAAIVYEEYGCFKMNGGSFAIVGGFCGGPEGAIIESIAKTLAAWIIYRDGFQYGGCVRQHLESRTYIPRRRPEDELFIWPSYVINTALNRNTNVIRFGGFYGLPTLGARGSLEALVLQGLSAMANTVLGSSVISGGLLPPLTEFLLDVSDATIQAGLTVEEMSEVLQQAMHTIAPPSACSGLKILDRRMVLYTNPTKYFAPLQQQYDFVKQHPSQAFLENVTLAKRCLSQYGLEF
jgi:methylamine--corrinoid protein Co-methyltransferase